MIKQFEKLTEKERELLWLKEIAPTTDLRKWFSHDPAKWKEFRTDIERNSEIIRTRFLY